MTISLCNLEINARIGVDSQERIVGNDFLINISVILPADNFCEENLESSLSYVLIYDIVRNILAKEWMLLETVAKRIGEEIEKIIDFYYIGIEVSISKLSVPISGIKGFATVSWKSVKD